MVVWLVVVVVVVKFSCLRHEIARRVILGPGRLAEISAAVIFKTPAVGGVELTTGRH